MGHNHAHDDGHGHGTKGSQDRKWLLAALAVILVFMVGEVIAGITAHSLALITDAGHMLSDAAALAIAVWASRIAERPAKGRYTFGFARVDALSGQANGLTLLLLAVWFFYEAIRRIISPPEVEGVIVVITAILGVGFNLLALLLASKASSDSLNVKGALAHLLNDLWAFVATAVAGTIVLTTGWRRADAVASMVVAALMVHAGVGLVRAAGRVFLEAAPEGLDPAALADQLTSVDGVSQLHDLHVWDLGAGVPAMSAHVLVEQGADCHAIASSMRALMAEKYKLTHATLQVDHGGEDPARPGEPCEDSHGPIHTKQSKSI